MTIRAPMATATWHNEPWWMKAPTSKVAEAFIKFHHNNPRVYDELERRALDAYRAGVKRISIAMLVEVVRYDSALATRGDPYKINNSHRAYYTRLLVYRFPQLGTIFLSREVKVG